MAQMEPSCSVQVTDRDGWQKTFPLEKPLVHIGSDPRNDIVLSAQQGTGVAPRHLQLIGLAAPKPGYRAVNLGDQGIPVSESGVTALAPRSALEITNGVSLTLGEFTLVFYLGEPWTDTRPEPVGRPPAGYPAQGRPPEPAHWAGRGSATGITRQERTSAVIGLKLSLPDRDLDPDSPLEGSVIVRNQGHEPGVQFLLELEGLEPRCYEMGPGPILFPNVEKGVSLRLHHPRGPNPPAGRHIIRVHATAPEAYPGESAIVSREFQILPYYSHALSLVTMD
jgi:hypothetical protein